MITPAVERSVPIGEDFRDAHGAHDLPLSAAPRGLVSLGVEWGGEGWGGVGWGG
jgi:hypothetical protein